MLVDTHTHLYLDEFDDGGDAAVQRALDAGVGHFVMPNVDLATIEPMRALAARWPDKISMAMGLHPTEVNDSWHDDLQTIDDEFDNHLADYVAVGEVGIDLYWDKTYEEQQMQVFDNQLSRAEHHHLPVIIHCRDGLDQVLEVISAHPKVQAVFHSFGGTVADVERIRRYGDYYFGINGIVTFKNSKLRDTLPAISTDRLLLETDSPYLAPVPHRGKRNESAFITATAAHVAQCLNLSNSQIADITSRNAADFFKINI